MNIRPMTGIAIIAVCLSSNLFGQVTETPLRKVVLAQADAETALKDGVKAMDACVNPSEKATQIATALLAALDKRKAAENAKAPDQKNNYLIETFTRDADNLREQWQQADLNLKQITQQCLKLREQMVTLQGIFTLQNQILDAMKKTEVNIEAVIPTYNAITEQVRKLVADYKSNMAQMTAIQEKWQANTAEMKTKHGL